MQLKQKKKLGLIVNPIAGMGGKVGLKGSDGQKALYLAKELGAKPESNLKTKQALEHLLHLKDDFDLVTCPGLMGENVAKDCGITTTIIGMHNSNTTAEDTMRAASEMKNLGVSLILVAGGDGTARDIHKSIAESIPVLGIPAGVKIYSGIYALTAYYAGKAVAMFLSGDLSEVKLAEIMDIDENAFRNGKLSAQIYGYMYTLDAPTLVQGSKTTTITTEKEEFIGISRELIRLIEKDTYYIISSGTTLQPMMDELGLQNTLLGVDIIFNNKLVASDVNENTILEFINARKAKIIVTIIGGQGYIFGRGNQQISSKVIKTIGKENIIVASSSSKLTALSGNPLRVDTGDRDLDNYLSGYMPIITGFKQSHMYKVV